MVSNVEIWVNFICKLLKKIFCVDFMIINSIRNNKSIICKIFQKSEMSLGRE